MGVEGPSGERCVLETANMVVGSFWVVPIGLISGEDDWEPGLGRLVEGDRSDFPFVPLLGKMSGRQRQVQGFWTKFSESD